MLVAAFSPRSWFNVSVTGAALLLLAVLGAIAARVGGAAMWRGALRVAFWGALAMGVSSLVGRVFGTKI